ncbi:MAG: TIGR01244 family sulfur transferase [Gammaproteobacteria bacterium]|nr:TIGR01244 family sulfur transferase [Gammaproteobacteria bacterium]
MQIYKLTNACSVAAQIQPSDVEALKQSGYGTVVCNRPDGEDFGQPTAASIAAECADHGVAFHRLPISNSGITAEMVQEFQKILAESSGPVLAYCRSGQRSSVLWQYSGTL